ncbi:MAG: RHS repeat domain-containing protein, partial [Terriglobia bacterium]
SVNSSFGHTGTFGYDALSRLTSAVATGSSQYSYSFSYDRFGNMTCTPSNGQCATLSYNPSTNRINTSGYTYDAAGELTADGTGNTYAWNAEGRLTGTSAWSGAVYNALEERTERIPLQGDTADYLYDPWGQDIGHYDATQGYWYDEYIPFGGRTLAEYKASAPPQTVTQFYHANALGSRSMATDAMGNYLEETQYNPLGQNWQSTGAVWDQRFGGMPIFDADLGLDATAFRMYAPLQGRWLTPDPLGGDVSNPQSLNRYAYALNNPETLTDPEGLGPCFWGACSHITAPAGSSPIPGGLDEFDFINPEFGGGPILAGTPAPAGNCPAEFVNCVQTLGGTVGLNSAGQAPELSGSFFSNGEFAGQGAIDSFLLSFANFDPSSGGAVGGSGGGGTAGCTGKILGAVNQQFGTGFTSGNVQGLPFKNGGAVNLNIAANGLPAAQFNAIVPGRYPLSFLTWLTGYGPTLHIAGPGPFDKGAVFSNTNIGGVTSVLFTTHIDSAFAYNPIGLALHLAIDLAGNGSRNPCP